MRVGVLEGWVILQVLLRVHTGQYSMSVGNGWSLRGKATEGSGQWAVGRTQ
jgi:hypothetical protein